MNTQLPLHPLQCPEWGEFREKTGIPVIRVAPGFQMTLHNLPFGYRIGYLPKCDLPTPKILKELVVIGKKHNCIFMKLEPNIVNNNSHISIFSKIQNTKYKIHESKHPLFTKYTFHIDLTKSEDELLQQMKPKTRYNVRLAEKRGVVVKEETSKEAFATYLQLAEETWKRQKFFGHDRRYHQLMWETLHPSGIAHLLIAYLQSDLQDKNAQYQIQNTKYKIPLVAWIVFLYKDILYYPYGASSSEYKEVMASNLMLWEAMKWGKSHGAKVFDLWGSLGPDADPKDEWYGFHKFKEGYGGKLVELVGSYDLVINPVLYQIYTILHPIRQKLLKLL
ncbi:peptidoglycan bridge formation glycyltransferase FemA/FemB family protein [Candidatus Roizmanbacteria bacterium]|nr:peptidoglycan bridge formation glycyltransferase FemA/FemB family protein [Candidatus Roizmanbacteria bacterium]